MKITKSPDGTVTVELDEDSAYALDLAMGIPPLREISPDRTPERCSSTMPHSKTHEAVRCIHPEGHAGLHGADAPQEMIDIAGEPTLMPLIHLTWQDGIEWEEKHRDPELNWQEWRQRVNSAIGTQPGEMNRNLDECVEQIVKFREQSRIRNTRILTLLEQVIQKTLDMHGASPEATAPELAHLLRDIITNEGWIR